MRVGRSSISTVVAVAIGLIGIGAAAPSLAAEDPSYELPALAGTALTVWQGTGSGLFRGDGEDDAFDFVAAEGPTRFTVAAARGGTVIGARSGVRGGRCDTPGDAGRPACWRDVNYVLVDHGDGTSGLYSHLRAGQSPVRIGEVVSAGQPIGVAGNSGWTDRTSLRFQVQRTPPWNERGRGGWFLTESLPVRFSDAEVLALRPDGVPQPEDVFDSDNPGPAFAPFRFRARPAGLPANVPLEPGASGQISAAYQADAAVGYGLRIAPPLDAISGDSDPGAIPGPEARPLFGGELAFAGCATGAAASLGRTVAISLEVDGTPYLAVHGGLGWIEPALLDRDPAAPLIVGPNDTIGRFGSSQPLADDQTLDCPLADPTTGDLFVSILRDGAINPDGEIIGGTPVSPEPLVGELGYEGFAWWQGPVVGVEVVAEPGRPRARWNARTPAGGSHVTFGETVRLVARVRDVTDVAQVRFRAWYPRWPQVAASRELTSFDPASAWRELALCVAPLDGRLRGVGSLCDWNGDARDARVTYVWDPQTARPQPSAPWLPPAERAITRASSACVPVSLAVEVIDRAGHVYSQVERLPLPGECDDRAAEAVEGARVLYLDPLVPPRAPAPLGKVRDRGWPPVYEPDPLKGAIVWRDRSRNEDGFRIYARRHWFEADCSITKGPWKEVATLAPNKERYRPNHGRVQRSLPVPDLPDVPGAMSYWEYAVSAYNEAGETTRVRVGGFLGGSEAYCDAGLVPPPELEP